MNTLLPLRITFLTLILGGVSACNNSKSDEEQIVSTTPTASSDATASVEPINPRALQAAGMVTLRRQLSQITEDMDQMVIRSAAEWQAIWSGKLAEGETVPDVDFDKYMVIGVTATGNNCHHIGISDVQPSATALTVHQWHGFPPPTLMNGRLNICSHLFSRDEHFVLVPQSDLPVQFVDHTWETANPAWLPSLQAQARPYESRMPQIIDNNNPTACTELIVPFAVRATNGELPQQLKVNAVGVAQQGVTHWLQPASASETGVAPHLVTDNDWLQDAAAGATGGKVEPVLRGVARGCTSAKFQIDLPVTVLISVGAADGKAEVSTDANLAAIH